MDVHVQFQLLFEEFHVVLLKSIHSGFRRNELQASSAKARHCTRNHLARWVFHYGYNIFLVKTLTQSPPNVHVARYKLLYGAFIRKQHFFPLSESPLTMTSGKVQSLFFLFFFSSLLVSDVDLFPGQWDFNPNSLLKHLETVLVPIDGPFKCTNSKEFLP